MVRKDRLLSGEHVVGLNIRSNVRFRETNTFSQNPCDDPMINSNHIPLWAGIECTINRVGAVYFDQCKKNGYYQRLTDIQRFANLGIERLRAPFLWESCQPTLLSGYNWEWHDAQVLELKRSNINPIVGLLHHGSGPLGTHLLDHQFPEKFAVYARAFAERYPWLTDYTPINEPLTTARFSGLYGIWFPHHQSDRSMIRMLWNQVKATILAMKEIRKVNPLSRLIQTEDLGKAQGTNPLQYQVEFENSRRWLAFDFLCGNINEDHPLFTYLREQGLSHSEIDWLSVHRCPPDIVGINHYPLSNRFIDHRLEQYPLHLHGGNGHDLYADVGAVDTTAAELISPRELLREAWERYQIPVAITEVHLRGPREAQLRWLQEVLQAARIARDDDGVPVQAVTAWSLLGSFDWSNLCSDENHNYESGVFDLRAPEPRPTALSRMIESHSQGKSFSHPVLNLPGTWWLRERAPWGPRLQTRTRALLPRSQPLLIVGAGGTLGTAFTRVCDLRNIAACSLKHEDLDISQAPEVRRAIEEIRPWAVVNAAGYVRVDQAEWDQKNCFRKNVLGPQVLSEITNDFRIPLLHFSSDLVFDGQASSPYLESSSVGPLSFYGATKAASEKKVLERNPFSLVVRTSAFFGPWDHGHFIYSVIKSLSSGKDFEAASDVTISPTYVPDLVEACIDLLIDGMSGLLHLTNQGHLTWADLAERTMELARHHRLINPRTYRRDPIIRKPFRDLNLIATRPRFSALRSTRAQLLPGYEQSLQKYFETLEASPRLLHEIKLESHL